MKLTAVWQFLKGQNMEEDGCHMVECWLRSIGHVQYTRAFLDNGYDDIEICKHIESIDLDAIGVYKPEHRTAIYTAVEILRQDKGPSKPLYFQLENPNSPSKLNANGISDFIANVNCNMEYFQRGDSQESSLFDSTSISSGISDNTSEESFDMLAVLESYATGKTSDKNCHTMAKNDGINRSTICHKVLVHSVDSQGHESPNSTTAKHTDSFEIEEIDSNKGNSGFSSLCSGKSSKSSLEDERNHSHRLSKASSCISMTSDSHSNNPARQPGMRSSLSLRDEELLEGRSRSGLRSSTSFSGTHGYSSRRRAGGWRPLSLAEPSTSGCTMMSAYGQSNRSVPPPLPSNPPPVVGSYSDMSDVDAGMPPPVPEKRVPEIECLTDSSAAREHAARRPLSATHHSLDHKQRFRSITRFFSFRSKSAKRPGYKSPNGGLHAKDITMSDEDRIRLLIMVKEGRISMDEAINTVKRYEDEKKSGVHRNLNHYIPQDVKVPVATEKSSRFSPLRFLRSFSFIKGSKRKQFLRDLELYYKEQEKRQKLIHERMSAVKIEDGTSSNYSQPVCCSSNECSNPERQTTCHVCSHGNSSHARGTQPKTSPSDFFKHKDQSQRRPFINGQGLSSHEWHGPDRLTSHPYTDHGVPPGCNSFCVSAHQTRHAPIDHRDLPQGACAQCHPMPSHARRQMQRSNTQPNSMPSHANPYFQRDMMRHSFHSVPVRGHTQTDHVPYLHDMPYESYSYGAHAYQPYDPHGYPFSVRGPHRGYGVNPNTFCHPGMMPHTIMEERSPCVSTRSSMENIHMHSPVHIPIQPRTNPNRHFAVERISEDISNNNPSFSGEHTNSLRRSRTPTRRKIPVQVHTQITQEPVQNTQCDSLGIHSNTINDGDSELREEYKVQHSQHGVSSGILADDDENANATELSTSSMTTETTESGCGASIRSSQQENYAQTCHLGRHPSVPETVEALCCKLGIQHLQDIFINNGFETLELFKQLEEEDLETLGVTDPTDRAKVLTAVTLLPDDDCDSFTYNYRPMTDIYSTVNKRRSKSLSPAHQASSTAADLLAPPDMPARDSGCYSGVDNGNAASAPATVSS